MVVSYATQSLFNANDFYTLLQNRISLNPTLSKIALNAFNPFQQPIIQYEDLIHLPLTTRLSGIDTLNMETILVDFIYNNSIGKVTHILKDLFDADRWVGFIYFKLTFQLLLS